jgi:hypothetical protein
MINRTGIANSTKGTTVHGQNQFSLQNQIDSIQTQIISARVIDIVLNENHSYFDQVGKENGIGAIFFEVVNSTGTKNNILNNSSFALPLIPNIKIYPLINEIVTLIKSPNNQTGKLNSSTSYFYFPPLGIWNNPHHNAYPNLLTNTLLPDSQQQDYQQVEGGMVRRITDGSTEINLNSPINPSQNSFVEKSNIHPLMPFMGDIIYEGRYGNSLRFGSTSKSQSKYKNNWSEGGNNGDPITILRNGQPTNSTDEGWIPTTENINNDLASIYLTSNQKIPFNLSQPNLISYNGSAPDPKTFTSPQIILNSTRIILNAKTDNILISGQQSVSLSSIKSVNIDAPKTIIQSSNIFLGDSNAVERGVMGDTLYNKLDVVLESLITLVRVLEAQQLWPGGLAAPDGGMMTTSSTVKSQLTNIKTTLTEILSKTVKTT